MKTKYILIIQNKKCSLRVHGKRRVLIISNGTK